MSKQVSIPTRNLSFEEVNKSLKELEKKCNQLFEIVNSSYTDKVAKKEGSIRINKTSENNYSYEVYTEDGWKSLMFGGNEIKLGDINDTYNQNTTNSINEIEHNDILTSSDATKKVLLNPNSGRFDVNHLINFPRADFITPWLPLSTNNATITIEGNIGTYSATGTTTIKHPDIFHGLGTRLLFPYIIGRYLDMSGE